jgi:hypothetical protein
MSSVRSPPVTFLFLRTALHNEPIPAQITASVSTNADIDVNILVSTLVSLHLHLQAIVTRVLPALLSISARLSANVLVDTELTALLHLLAEIKLVIVAVPLALVQLVVSVKVDLLARIAVELLAIVGCVLSIAGPVVQVCLGAVTGIAVTVGTNASAIVDVSAEISAAAEGIQGVNIALQGSDSKALVSIWIN